MNKSGVVEHNQKSYRLSDMSRDELKELKLLIDNDADAIKGQLDLARSVAKSDGDYADPHWFRRAEGARRIKSRQSQAIQLELSRRKQRDGATVAEHFVNIARIRLHETVFMSIMSDAHDAMRLERGEK